MMRLHAWVAAACLLATPALAQGFNYDRFQPSTLATLTAALATDVADSTAGLPAHGGGDKFFDTRAPARLVRATYTGKERPLDADELEYVRNFHKAIQQDRMASLYEKALLFQSDGKDYWLPVQTAVIPFFAKELKVGQPVDLYVIQPGGLRRREGGWEWLFLVEEFQDPTR